MKDLLVLCLLIVFIIVAHSWKNPEVKKPETSKPPLQSGIVVQTVGITSGKETSAGTAISGSEKSVSKKNKYEKAFLKPLINTSTASGSSESYPIDNGQCPVHRFHSEENNILCPYYEAKTILMSFFNNGDDNVYLLRYNN